MPNNKKVALILDIDGTVMGSGEKRQNWKIYLARNDPYHPNPLPKYGDITLEQCFSDKSGLVNLLNDAYRQAKDQGLDFSIHFATRNTSAHVFVPDMINVLKSDPALNPELQPILDDYAVAYQLNDLSKERPEVPRNFYLFDDPSTHSKYEFMRVLEMERALPIDRQFLIDDDETSFQIYEKNNAGQKEPIQNDKGRPLLLNGALYDPRGQYGGPSRGFSEIRESLNQFVEQVSQGQNTDRIQARVGSQQQVWFEERLESEFSIAAEERTSPKPLKAANKPVVSKKLAVHSSIDTMTDENTNGQTFRTDKQAIHHLEITGGSAQPTQIENVVIRGNKEQELNINLAGNISINGSDGLKIEHAPNLNLRIGADQDHLFRPSISGPLAIERCRVNCLEFEEAIIDDPSNVRVRSNAKEIAIISPIVDRNGNDVTVGVITSMIKDGGKPERINLVGIDYLATDNARQILSDTFWGNRVESFPNKEELQEARQNLQGADMSSKHKKDYDDRHKHIFR